MARFQDLPPEVLSIVFSHVTSSITRSSLEPGDTRALAVCLLSKPIYNIVRLMVWQNIHIHTAQMNDDREAKKPGWKEWQEEKPCLGAKLLEHLLERPHLLRNTQHLVISLDEKSYNSSELDGDDIATFLAHCGSITFGRIDFEDCLSMPLDIPEFPAFKKLSNLQIVWHPEQRIYLSLLLERSASTLRSLLLDAAHFDYFATEPFHFPSFVGLEDLRVSGLPAWSPAALDANLKALGTSITSLNLNYIAPDFAYGLLDQLPSLFCLELSDGWEEAIDGERLSFSEVVTKLGRLRHLQVLNLDCFEISPTSLDMANLLPSSIVEFDLSRIQPVQSLTWRNIYQLIRDDNWLPNLSAFDCSLLDPYDEAARQALDVSFGFEGNRRVGTYCDYHKIRTLRLFSLVERGNWQEPLWERAGPVGSDIGSDIGFLMSDYSGSPPFSGANNDGDGEGDLSNNDASDEEENDGSSEGSDKEGEGEEEGEKQSDGDDGHEEVDATGVDGNISD